MTKVSPEEFKNNISNIANAVIIDVRTSQEYNQGHILDTDMIGIISDLLGYDYESDDVDEVKNYGVSHSNKLYIVDKEGNVRVVWRGIEWTYASVYHDIQILL